MSGTYSLAAIAKRASECAGRNAGVAPELLYADIFWVLQDAVAPASENFECDAAAAATDDTSSGAPTATPKHQSSARSSLARHPGAAPMTRDETAQPEEHRVSPWLVALAAVLSLPAYLLGHYTAIRQGADHDPPNLIIGQGVTARLGSRHGFLWTKEGGAMPSGWFVGPIQINTGSSIYSDHSDDGVGILILPYHASERFQ